jgi:hypothetical protein
VDETRHGRAAGRRRLLIEDVAEAVGGPVLTAVPVLAAGCSAPPGTCGGARRRHAADAGPTVREGTGALN